MSREAFYKHIDKHGIDGVWMGGMDIKIDLHHDNELPAITMKDDFFEPFMSGFDLDSADKIDLIKDYFKETFDVHLDSLAELRRLQVLHGNLFLIATSSYSKVVYKVVQKVFDSNLYLRNVAGVKNLGIIETIEGGLYLSNTSIETLHPLKHLKGDFWLSGTTRESLNDLGDLEVVDGSLNVSKSKISRLGCLRRVGGNLNLRATSIVDLSRIEEIGGNLLLNKEIKDQYVLDTKTVKGTIKYYTT